MTLYTRRHTIEVRIGNTPMGGENPIRVQSMTTTSTMDTEGSAQQAKRIVDAGGEYVRLTTQGTREAENLTAIHERLKELGVSVPLVADVHFNPVVAEVAARHTEKVRINPGNYIDPARTFKSLEYTDEEYAQELERLEARFVPFLRLCRENNTAIRIGVNHGSLSDRIMSHYGDTPEGIVESCMEFLRICVKESFTDVVISIKASNTVVMVRSVRLLVEQMDKEGMFFPLHLGVTEAGEGEDGRIKSAVGIGALLAEGIGDTIRVSLSEEPEEEIPVAKKLVAYIEECAERRAEAKRNIKNDTISLTFDDESLEDFQLKAAMVAGALLIDGCARELILENRNFYVEVCRNLADSILQAARVRFTKTEYISCPGCGRTLYDLRSTIARIKAAIGEKTKTNPRFNSLKIGIMGCIVNGPGEMADADYGYVGAGRGKVSLYRRKECVMKNIPEEDAVEMLMDLINKEEK